MAREQKLLTLTERQQVYERKKQADEKIAKDNQAIKVKDRTVKEVNFRVDNLPPIDPKKPLLDQLLLRFEETYEFDEITYQVP